MTQTRELIDRANEEADLCRNDGADDIAELLDALATRLEQADKLAEALEAIAMPLFVAEPAGTPDNAWRVALNERINRAQAALASWNPLPVGEEG